MALVCSPIVLLGTQAQASYQLQYVVGSKGSAYPGGTFTLANNFTNAGTVQLNIVSVVTTTDFGTFSPPSGLPFVLTVGQKKELDMDILVPSSASTGSHSFSASAGFQYMDPSTSQWVTPSNSPLVIQTNLTVGQSPSTAGLIGSLILGVIAALVAVVIVLVFRLRRKRAAEALPPTQAPPSPGVPPAPS